MRLLDLSNCKEYIDHALKYRVEKIKEDGSTIYNPDVEDISLSSVVLRGFPPRVKSPEENSSAASSENKIRKKVKSAPPYTNSGLHQPVMTVSQPVKGILHSESARGKSLLGRVSFQDEYRELPGVEKELLQPSESPPRSPKPSGMLHQMNGPKEGFREKHADGENVGVGVYMMVDRLRPGQCFVSKTPYLILSVYFLIYFGESYISCKIARTEVLWLAWSSVCLFHFKNFALSKV